MFKSNTKLVIGMVVLYFALAVSLKLNLGVAPNDALMKILSNILSIEVGSISIIVSLLYLLIAFIIYGKKFPKKEFLQIVFIISSGFLLNFFTYNLLKDFYIEKLYIRIIIYIIAVIFKVIGVLLIINSNIMKTALETLCQAIADKVNKNMPFIRQMVDIIYIVVIIILEFVIKDYSFISIGTLLDLVLFSQLLKLFNKIKFRNLIKQRRKENEI